MRRHPHRIEIDDSIDTHCFVSFQIKANLTMRSTGDQLNFQHIGSGTAFG